MPTLQFKGKTAVETYHYTVPHHTLAFDPASSVLEDDQTPSLDGSVIVEGDNLLALKALLPTHAGRIKCVYIDPPYNTGNEGWVYNDNLTQPQFKEWIGQVVGKEGEDACRHDKWCCMMYPRLMLLKELLHEDGVIFISIDDNEAAHLRLLMNEVFGEENFIAELIWEKTRKNDAKFFSVGHEYMLVFAQSLDLLKQQKTVWREAKPGAVEIMREYRKLRADMKEDEAVQEALRTWYADLPKTHPAKKLSRYKWVDKYGPWRDRDISWPGGNGPRYDVLHPVTGKPCKVPDSGWRFSSLESMQRQIDLGLIVFRDDETEPPFRKAHLAVIPEEYADDPADIPEDAAETEQEENDEGVGLQVMPSVIYKQSQVSVKYLRKLMGGKVFSNPKDHEVIERVLRLCTSGDDIVLDSFAGSGTTGQAVLELNKEDGGNRKFILVQQKYDSKDDEKKKLNICRTITAERVRRVIAGQGVPATGGGFSYARVSDTPLFGEYRDFGDAPPPYEDLAKYVFYTETSRQWDPAGRNEETGKVGAQGGTSYFLLYTPDGEANAALDLKWLENVAAADPNTRLVVYCEKFWMHRDELRRWEADVHKSVRPMIVPFQLK